VLRDRLIVRIMIFCGLAPSELISLRHSDIRKRAKVFLLRFKKNKHIDLDLLILMELNHLRRHLRSKDGFIFVSLDRNPERQGKQITQRQVRKILRKAWSSVGDRSRKLGRVFPRIALSSRAEIIIGAHDLEASGHVSSI